MKITIGDNTRKLMALFEIKDYPFSSSDLIKKYRAQLQIHHPDKHRQKGEEAVARETEITQQLIKAFDQLQLFASYEESANPEEKPPETKEDEQDLFKIWDNCPRCNGSGLVIITKEVFDFNAKCFNCDGSGWVHLKCKYCSGTGRFVQRNSGREVNCRACQGSGIWQSVKCKVCGNPRERFLGGYDYWRYKTVEESVKCAKCNGKGKIEIKPFNPVIRAGAVMF